MRSTGRTEAATTTSGRPGTATHVPSFAKHSGQRYYLQFRRRQQPGDGYVNGLPVGAHRRRVRGFRVDASDALRWGITSSRCGSTTRDPDPSAADCGFYLLRGLYRDVHLVSVNELHVDLQDDGSSGVYLSTRDVSASGAELSARVRVSNGAGAERSRARDALGARCRRQVGGGARG
jgi:beta-galactosidase